MEGLKIALCCAALAAATLTAAPAATADPCQGVYHQSGCRPAPWNGQQLDTWNIPGTYGGWTTTPVICDVQTTKCTMWAQP